MNDTAKVQALNELSRMVHPRGRVENGVTVITIGNSSPLKEIAERLNCEADFKEIVKRIKEDTTGQVTSVVMEIASDYAK